MINIDHKVILAGGLVAIVIYFIIRNDALKAGNVVIDAVERTGVALNPLSNENIFYRGVGAIVDSVSSDGEKKPLGSRIYDWLN